MKENLVFKGIAEKAIQEINETSNTYTLLCVLHGVEPTVLNALKLKREGW